MPIPTPEPPVKRYVLRQVCIGHHTDSKIEIFLPKLVPVEESVVSVDNEARWCKWSEVEALLLQRAQEIEQVKAAFEKAERELGFKPDDGLMMFEEFPMVAELIECVRAALVSRAPQPEP